MPTGIYKRNIKEIQRIREMIKPFVFQKGHKGYWFGKKHTEEYKTMMSNILKGRIPKNLDLLHKLRREKRWAPQKGSTHHNWKGGITSEVMKIRNSLEYKDWREKVFQRDDYTCWICEKRGGKLHSHHLKRFSDYPKLRFKISNGLTLCEFCHKTYTVFLKAEDKN